MRYMLMINVPHASGSYQYEAWAPEDVRVHMAFLARLNQELAAAGELVGIEALTPPGQARVVRAGKDGSPAVTDGPFPEAKEFLAGFWMVDVDRPARAYEIAARASAAPGPGGVPLVLPIEVREVMTRRASDV